MISVLLVLSVWSARDVRANNIYIAFNLALPVGDVTDKLEWKETGRCFWLISVMYVPYQKHQSAFHRLTILTFNAATKVNSWHGKFVYKLAKGQS
jgi:hypothetical protein